MEFFFYKEADLNNFSQENAPPRIYGLDKNELKEN